MTRILNSAVILALIISPVLRAQTTTGTGQETEATTDAATSVKTFDELSTGNQKIARALMDAQLLPHETSVQIWTLDQIAAIGSEKGWGQTFLEMQSEGLINARNLGQVVSSYQTNINKGVTASDQNPILTETSAAEEHTHNHGKENIPGTVTAGGIPGSADATGTAEANDDTFGHEPDLPASVGHGITTAAGTGASISFNHTLDEGGNGGNHFDSGINAGMGASREINAGVAEGTQGNAFGRGK